MRKFHETVIYDHDSNIFGPMIHWLEDILWLQVVLNLKKKVLFVNMVTRHLVAFKRNNQKYKICNSLLTEGLSGHVDEMLSIVVNLSNSKGV